MLYAKEKKKEKPELLKILSMLDDPATRGRPVLVLTPDLSEKKSLHVRACQLLTKAGLEDQAQELLRLGYEAPSWSCPDSVDGFRLGVS